MSCHKGEKFKYLNWSNAKIFAKLFKAALDKCSSVILLLAVWSIENADLAWKIEGWQSFLCHKKALGTGRSGLSIKVAVERSES